MLSWFFQITVSADIVANVCPLTRPGPPKTTLRILCCAAVLVSSGSAVAIIRGLSMADAVIYWIQYGISTRDGISPTRILVCIMRLPGMDTIGDRHHRLGEKPYFPLGKRLMEGLRAAPLRPVPTEADEHRSDPHRSPTSAGVSGCPHRPKASWCATLPAACFEPPHPRRGRS